MYLTHSGLQFTARHSGLTQSPVVMNLDGGQKVPESLL